MHYEAGTKKAAVPVTSTRNLAATGCLDRSDIDLFHPHHCFKCAFCFLAARRNGFGQDTRRDLPGHAPLVLAPAAGALLTSIGHDGIPIAIRLRLVIGCDLKRKGFSMFERGAAIEADAGNPSDPEFDESTSPFFPDG